MDIRQIVHFESKKDNHIYRYEIPSEGTYGAAIDALFEILDEVRKMQDKAAERARLQIAEMMSKELQKQSSEDTAVFTEE